MHEVRIYDGKLKLKKIISAEDVRKNYWKNVTNGYLVQPRNGRDEYKCDLCQEPFTPIIRSQKFCCPEHQRESIDQTKRIKRREKR